MAVKTNNQKRSVSTVNVQKDTNQPQIDDKTQEMDSETQSQETTTTEVTSEILGNDSGEVTSEILGNDSGVQGQTVDSEETEQPKDLSEPSDQDVVDNLDESTEQDQETSATDSTNDTVVSNLANNENNQPQKGFLPVYKVELALNGYNEAMDKKNAVVPEIGGKWQYSLFKSIKECFNANSQETFNAEFNTILNFFNKNKEGIFNEKFLFRFAETWPGSQTEYTQNRRLIFFIIQTADPANRKAALENFNMEIVVEGMPEAQKQMLFNFYQM